MAKKSILFFIYLMSASILYGSTPKIKTFKSQQDFQDGTPHGISISPSGELMLSPDVTEIFKTNLPFLWTGAADSKGNVYVAGGNSGQVYKIDPQGNASVVLETDEVQIFALTVDKQDNVFVGTSPQGKVYKLPSGKNFSAENAVFFDPDDIYIWAMAINSNGELFVATGEEGRVYKVDKSGQGKVFYTSDEAHIRQIAFDNQGNIIVGTANRGLVLRIEESGKAFVLYDSPMVEITALAVDNSGRIYAAATGDSQLQRGALRPESTQAESQEQNSENVRQDSDAPDASVQQAVVTTSAARANQIGELYRIDENGAVRLYQTWKSERIYAMHFSDNGDLLLGTGEEGRIYSLNQNGEIALLTQIEDMQITLLTGGRNGKIHIGSSNSGRLFTLGRKYRASGYFLSQVVDAQVVSHWGSINWETVSGKKPGIKIQTRTGNTTEPDQTWSDWSADYTDALGSAISNSASRFIQLRVNLSTQDENVTPVLRELSFSYLQKNIAPLLRQVTILPAGEYYPEANSKGKNNSKLEGDAGGQNGFQNNGSIGRKSTRKGFRSVSWVAHDDNGDVLTYDVFYKAIEQKHWHELVTDYSNIVYSWDSELLPDGRYEIRVVANDASSNPPLQALRDERRSATFSIDNTGPEVGALYVEKRNAVPVFVFSVQDAMTSIKSVEYAVNADKWQLLYPVDGICDSKIERFELVLEKPLQSGDSVVIKTLDALDNVGFGKQQIE